MRGFFKISGIIPLDTTAADRQSVLLVFIEECQDVLVGTSSDHRYRKVSTLEMHVARPPIYPLNSVPVAAQIIVLKTTGIP